MKNLITLILLSLTLNLFAQFQCGESLFDTRDGNSYGTVQIGTQCWMSENLNHGILISASNNQTDNDLIEKFCFNNSEDSCDIYGGLYQWYEVMDLYVANSSYPEISQGTCPYEWHIPSDTEFTLLSDFLGGLSVSGGKLKETGISHWNSPNLAATNESGFTALSSGHVGMSFDFSNFGINSTFWTSTYSNEVSVQAKRYSMKYNTGTLFTDYINKFNGFSVRCISDNVVGNIELNIERTENPFPNPSTGIVTIPCNKTSELFIYNTKGSLIYNKVVFSDHNINGIVIIELPIGVYFYSINGNIKKIVIVE